MHSVGQTSYKQSKTKKQIKSIRRPRKHRVVHKFRFMDYRGIFQNATLINNYIETARQTENETTRSQAKFDVRLFCKLYKQ